MCCWTRYGPRNFWRPRRMFRAAESAELRPRARTWRSAAWVEDATWDALVASMESIEAWTASWCEKYLSFCRMIIVPPFVLVSRMRKEFLLIVRIPTLLLQHGVVDYTERLCRRSEDESKKYMKWLAISGKMLADVRGVSEERLLTLSLSCTYIVRNHWY